MQILLAVLGFVLFVGLILIHEWGHYIAARRNSVGVEEFGLGLPPRAWGKKLKSGMILSLNWLPLGGFVKLKGEHDSDTRPGSLGAASLSVKSQIMLAGVALNLLAGLLLLTLVALIGMPKLIDNQFQITSDAKIIHQKLVVGSVSPDSPAQKAGLASRDIIEKISKGEQVYIINSPQDLQTTTTSLAGQSVQIAVKRGGKSQIKTTTLLTKEEVEASQKAGDRKAYLGVSYDAVEIYRSSWSAPLVALGFTKQLFVLTMEGLGKTIAGLSSYIAGLVSGNQEATDKSYVKATSDVGGPVAIAMILWSGGSFGLNFLLFIVAIISLTLALINFMPLPALDGGRLTMTLVSRGIFRRPLDRKTEERLVGFSMALLLVLFALITIVDVKRFF